MSSPNGLIPSEISSRVREFKPELNAWPSAMLAMLSLLARVFPSYESILAPDIGFISRSEDVNSSFFWLAETKALKPRTSRPLCVSRETYRSNCHGQDRYHSL